MCITHSFEGLLEGLMSCRGDCIGGVWFLGLFTRWGFLVFRLCWWWDLLLVLFLSHFLKAIVQSLWHLQGRWRKERRQQCLDSQTRLCPTVSCKSPCVLKIKLIYQTVTFPSPHTECSHPASMACVMGCCGRQYSCNPYYNSQRNRVKRQQHAEYSPVWYSGPHL